MIISSRLAWLFTNRCLKAPTYLYLPVRRWLVWHGSTYQRASYLRTNTYSSIHCRERLRRGHGAISSFFILASKRDRLLSEAETHVCRGYAPKCASTHALSIRVCKRRSYYRTSRLNDLSTSTDLRLVLFSLLKMYIFYLLWLKEKETKLLTDEEI